jgi:PAS domain S-box-containing protein
VSAPSSPSVRSRFAEIATLLGSSLDLGVTLENVIGLCLPALGDFGFFDVITADGDVQRVARAHEDAGTQTILAGTRWARNERTDLILCALSTGRAGMHHEVGDAWLRDAAENEEHLAVMRRLDFGSMLTVPVPFRGELLGALTLFFRSGGRRYGPREQAEAEELASLAAPAVANARLFERHQRAERALRENEERLRLALAAARCGIWDWDLAAGRVTWSDRIYELHGVRPGEFDGSREAFNALVHPDDRERVGAAIRRALEDGMPYDVELRALLPDGGVRWLSTQGGVLRDAGGRPVRMLGATVDATERVRLRGAERAALAEAERARAAAEQASRAKDDFLAMLGHELRNPLAPIRTALDLLALKDGSGNTARERQVIGRQVAHLTRLVDDLLDVARITRGAVSVERKAVDVAAVVGRALEMSAPLLEARGLVVVTDLPGGIVVDGDAVRLAQVFANLLANAAKYSAPGGRVEVAASAGAREVVVRVRDHGVGIEPNLLPHVFDLFVQGAQHLDRAQGGMGIGLTIVRSLVELHGGRVAAASDGPGTGAELVVTLPRRAGGAATASPGPVGPGPRGEGAHVLVVDDNHDAADLLVEVLALGGYEARAAYDAEEALAIARADAPDAAILDIGLPGMDGYELARAMRDLSAGVRLVALTGYARDGDRRRTAAVGFDAHLVKPVDLEALQRVLAGLLG